MSCTCKYITLFRGDDSNFEFNQKVSLVIKTDLDLSGCSAHFSLLGVQQDFDPIPADKTLELVFPSADTSNFPLGMANGKLWLTDAEGRIRTVSNSIHFSITKDVEKAYGDSSEQTITVDIQSIGNYDALSNKPSINGVTLIGNKTGYDLGLADITYVKEELTRVEGKADSAASAASSAQSTADTARREAATAQEAAEGAKASANSALSAAQAAQQTADDATSALDSKRDVTDLLVRGNPTGEGSWFSVNGDAYSYRDGTWTRVGSPFDAILPGESTGAYVITGSDDVDFSLDADYSATVTYLGTTYTIIGYVDTIAKVSEIPTRTSQLTNDSGYITSNDVHGDYIEDADGNRINADRTIEEKDPDAPWVLSLSSFLPYTLEKKDSNHWQYEQPENKKLDLFYYTQEGMWDFIEYYWNGSEWEFVTAYPAVNESAIGNPDATYLQLGDPAYGTATRQLMKSGKLALEAAIANKKDKQNPVSSPSATGNATSFIDSISQNAEGVITPTKKTIPSAAPSTSGAGGKAGLMSAADKEKLNGIAEGATAVAVDATLTQQGAAADAKAVGDALRSGFTEWEFSGNVSPGVTYTIDIAEYEGAEGPVYVASLDGSDGASETVGVDSLDVVTILFSVIGITATRHLVTPTKTSQLENDGAPNGGGTPYATTAQIPDVTGKADKVSGATAGNLASLDSSGNLADSGVNPSDFATPSDLPYALVTPGEWEFSGSGVESGVTYTIEEYEVDGTWYYDLNGNGEPYLVTTESSQRLLTVDFWDDGDGYHITATRASLPGHLLDRAVSAVSVTGATTLTLPALVNAGKSRDFYLKMTVTGSQSVSFSPPSGVAYTGYGNPAKTYSAGTYVLRFTETSENEFCVTDMLAKYAAAHHVHSAGDITSGTLDAARLPVATGTTRGAVQVDGTTITVANGVISAVGGGGGGGGGAIATISMTSDGRLPTQCVHIGSRTYYPLGNVSGVVGFGQQPVVAPVFEGEIVSVNFDEYELDCLIYKNGVGQESIPSTLTAGDAWVICFGSCLAYGTLVLMADGTFKRVEDVSVGDEVASAEPSDGVMSRDVVVNVSRGFGSEKDDWTFEGGRTVSTVGRHRFWNVDLGEMLYLVAWNVGERARVFDGTSVKLVSRATSYGEFRHATLWTEKWNNYFANGLLAGNRNTVKGEY